jgi:hypothetical protein
MSRLLWFFGWAGTAVWSLFALAAYGLVDVLGTSAMRHADTFSQDPETVEWLFRMFSWGRGLSVSVILVVWGVVTLAILSVPWLFDRLAGSPRPLAYPPGTPVSQAPMSRDGVIDLSPGEWSVKNGPGRPGSSVPQVPPRFGR